MKDTIKRIMIGTLIASATMFTQVAQAEQQVDNVKTEQVVNKSEMNEKLNSVKQMTDSQQAVTGYIAQIGDAIASAAKGIGVATGDLINSPIGFIAMFGLLIHFVGASIFKFFIAMGVVTLSIILGRWVIRIIGGVNPTIDNEGKLVKKGYSINENISGDAKIGIALFACVLIGANIIMLLNLFG